MDKKVHIKTHFDGKVLLVLILVFLVSCGLLAFKINVKATCNVKAFNIKANSFKEGELITFSDVTPGAYEWRWYFGDGTDISFRSRVGHSFAKAGKYTVKLLVNGNCPIEKEITIIPKKEVLNMALMPKFSAATLVHEGEEVRFTDATTHAKSWEWRFGDSDKIGSIDKNPKHVYRLPGEKIVSLVVNGDIKYVQYLKITVLPAKISKKDWVKERIARRSDSRVDPVKEYFSQIPQAPKRGPEIDNINEAKFTALLLGIAENKLSYQNLTKYFCEDELPLVQVKKGGTISLKALDEAVRNKTVKIKKVTLHRDKDNCVTLIVLDYKTRSLF